MPTFSTGMKGPEAVAALNDLNAQIIAAIAVAERVLLSGATAPSDSLGVDGDFYIDYIYWIIYGPKTSGAWPAGVSLIGPQGNSGSDGANGANGNTILYGSGAPDNSNGIDGNFYIDDTSKSLYGPKAAGSWPAGVSLIGPKGDKGDIGATGDVGTAATVSVGTVTTGAAGSSVIITNSGTSSSAVLDFTIPRGDPGADGTGNVNSVNGVAPIGGNVSLTKADIVLGNVDNTADTDKPVSTATQAALNLKLDSSQVGASSGVAPLGADSKVPSAYLPSYVDDVLEYPNLASFPASGETSKIYTALDTNKIYRWSGSAYVEISASPGSTDAVPEGATNKYFTESRVLATILSGLSTATNAAITVADSALSAFGKLQKQITDLIASAATKTGVETLTNKTINLANNSVTVDGTNEVGYRNIPQNSKSANYTCALSDAGNHIYHPSADTTARTFTIPANASVAYPIGTALTFVNDSSAGTVTISITTDTMILAGAGTTGSRTLAANGIATALKMTATRWIISGTNLT